MSKLVFCHLKPIKMNSRILFNISNLLFEGNGIANTDFFSLTNKDDIRDNFYTENYITELGERATKYTPKSVFGFYDVSINTDGLTNPEIQKEFGKIFHRHIQFVEGFISIMWLIKDNSIGMLTSVCQTPEIKDIQTISGRINSRNCKGKKELIIFSPDEIKEVGLLTIKLAELCQYTPVELDGVVNAYEKDKDGKPFRFVIDGLSKDFNYNKTNCIDRAFQFLATARSQEYLVYKIAYYMPIFECLFSTDSSEITSKLGFRTAFYIGSNKEEQKEIFKVVTEGYNVRSKFLHGQLFSSDNHIVDEKLLKLSIRIDEILRIVLNKIIREDSSNFLAKKKERDTFFNNLIFR